MLLFITIVTMTVNFNSSNYKKDVIAKSFSYADINSDKFKEEFNDILKENYGLDYKSVIEKNSVSIKAADKINQMFLSPSSSELNYPEYIGGLYINDNNELVIQIKKEFDISKNEKLYSTYNLMISINNDAIIEYVENSYSELEKINNQINDYYKTDKSYYYNISANYIDVINNIVVVELFDISMDKQKEFKKNIIDSDLIIFKQGSEIKTQAYNPGQSTTNCSLGFRARVSSSNTGFVTAGHCVNHLSVGSSYYSYGILRKNVYNSGIDAAYIQTSTSVTNTLQYGVYPVTKLSTSIYQSGIVNGALIGKSGSASGGSSGQITATSYTAYVGNIQFKDLIKTNYISQNGDSGGPVFLLSNSIVIGIHMGGDTNNPSLKFATKYSKLASTLGISLY